MVVVIPTQCVHLVQPTVLSPVPAAVVTSTRVVVREGVLNAQVRMILLRHMLCKRSCPLISRIGARWNLRVAKNIFVIKDDNSVVKILGVKEIYFSR